MHTKYIVYEYHCLNAKSTAFTESTLSTNGFVYIQSPLFTYSKHIIESILFTLETEFYAS